MNRKEIKETLKDKFYIQKKGISYWADKFKLPEIKIQKILEEIKKEDGNTYEYSSSSYNPDNVLVIGDLHAPFILEGYLEFNQGLQKKYNCGTVIFIGDIIDSNSWSYHEKNVDGLGVKDELYAAKKQLSDWYKAFPNAIILYGNHDLLISRKANTAGLSQSFIKDLGDVIEAPRSWKFTHEVIINGVKYIHGSFGDAIKRAKEERLSVVQGHLHSKCFVEWAVSEKDAIFGLQIGCGIDRNKYAFDYAKPMAKKPVISSGLVLEKGTLPLIELMKL